MAELIKQQLLTKLWRLSLEQMVELRSSTVRLELKPLLDRGVPDHQLMEVVREITAREEENKRKFGLKASAKAVEGDFCTREDGKILALMNKLSTQLDEQKLTSDRQQKTIEHLQKQLNNQTGEDGKKGKQRKKFRNKCDECEKDGRYCNHCLKCLELGHKQADCPKNE